MTPLDLLRVQLNAELASVGMALDRYPMVDPMSVRIENWHRECALDLRRDPDPGSCVVRHATRLREWLKDPISRSPLEEESYLGNDDQVYGKQALLVYLDQMPEEVQGRSPARPDEDRLFVVYPHPIVKATVIWLKTKTAFEPLDAITERYTELEALRNLPQIPTETMAPRLERARRMQREARRRAAVPPPPPPEPRRPPAFEGVRREADAFAERLRRDAERMDADDQARIQALMEEMRKQRAENREAEEENRTTEGELKEAQAEVSALNGRVSSLNTSATNLEKTLDAKESRDSKSGLMQGVVIAACIAISIIASGGSAAPAGASTVQQTTVKATAINGGATVNVIIPLG